MHAEERSRTLSRVSMPQQLVQTVLERVDALLVPCVEPLLPLQFVQEQYAQVLVLDRLRLPVRIQHGEHREPHRQRPGVRSGTEPRSKKGTEPDSLHRATQGQAGLSRGRLRCCIKETSELQPYCRDKSATWLRASWRRGKRRENSLETSLAISPTERPSFIDSRTHRAIRPSSLSVGV